MTKLTTSNKNSVRQNILLTIVACFAFLFLYDLLAGNIFSLSDEWYRIAIFFSIITGILALFVDIWLRRNKKYKPDKKSGFIIKYYSLIFTPVFLAYMAYISIFIAPTSLYTQYNGTNYTDLIPVIKADLKKGTRRTCGDYSSYKVTNTKLKTTFYRPLCISKKHYDLLKNKDFIRISGKESFFGRTIY